MASVSFHIANLLEKMTSSDKDFRFMATNDLMAELQKDSIKLDDDSERKVVKMLLKLLEDKIGEVQNLAVKCLSPLVNKVKDVQVETIVETLCSNMLSDKEQLRDISSIGLKTVISELAPTSPALVASICKKITGRLTSAISKQEDVSVHLEALDILSDLLHQFGSLLITFHPSIQQALLPQLASPRLAVCKRAITAIAHLVMRCNNSLFVDLIEFLQTELRRNSSTSATRTYIQCLGGITRQAGHRIGEHLEKIIPLVVKYSRKEDDELREFCIQAFESFVWHCPKDVSPHIKMITNICLEYLVYDPNYNYDDEQSEESMDLDDGEEDGGDGMSWKVRRASAKCLAAIISTRHEMLRDFYALVAPTLISRFKEREENVKADIFFAYITLLKQTKLTVMQDRDAMDLEEGLVTQLTAQVPNIVKSMHKLLKERSIKTRQGCFSLLSELVQLLPGALKDHMAVIIPGVQFSLGDKNSSSNIKIDALCFINILLTNHCPVVFHPHVDALVPPIIAAVGDPFYKIASEALLVTQQLVKVLRPLDLKEDLDFRPYISGLYDCTLGRLKATDIDQEVKGRAISCMAQIICNLGDALGIELNTCLPIFLERLKNEITRLTAVKSVTLIAGSPLQINLSPILNECVPVLASFLRKNHRALRLSTLQCLDVLVKNYGQSMTTVMFDEIIKELSSLISENDLHVSQLSLALLSSICQISQPSVAGVSKEILPQILVLVRSPLLQGTALQAMMDFFQALVTSGNNDVGFRELYQMLVKPVYRPDPSIHVHKQAFHSFAKCIAALAISCPKQCNAVVVQFISDIKTPSATDNIRLLCLLTLGEIGKHIDLSETPELQGVILDSFSSPNEEVKSAASYALGNVSVGNIPKFLPFVLQEIDRQPKRQYLLLHSLKEIISCQSVNSNAVEVLRPNMQSIWELLIKNCECPEEGTRNVVAECLGKLTLMNPVELLPKLKSYLGRHSSMTRSTVISAIKFTISDQPQAIDPLLRQNMGSFLEALHDKDLNVRRVALVAFNSAAHNKPSLIRDLLQSGLLLPHLYRETKVRKELIREVEMKHTVDDGLDIRRAAFECLYTLLDSSLDQLDIFEFLKHVEDGLNDHYDIKMLTYLMLIRIGDIYPSAVVKYLDHSSEPVVQFCLALASGTRKDDNLKQAAIVPGLACDNHEHHPTIVIGEAFGCKAATMLSFLVDESSVQTKLSTETNRTGLITTTASKPISTYFKMLVELLRKEPPLSEVSEQAGHGQPDSEATGGEPVDVGTDSERIEEETDISESSVTDSSEMLLQDVATDYIECGELFPLGLFKFLVMCGLLSLAFYTFCYIWKSDNITTNEVIHPDHDQQEIDELYSRLSNIVDAVAVVIKEANEKNRG